MSRTRSRGDAGRKQLHSPQGGSCGQGIEIWSGRRLQFGVAVVRMRKAAESVEDEQADAFSSSANQVCRTGHRLPPSAAIVRSSPAHGKGSGPLPRIDLLG